MAADTRSTHTDALATLGMIHTEQQARDAIHLGVEPVIAGEKIKPGEHIGLRDGKAYTSLPGFEGNERVVKAIGIADPFLTNTIYKGQKFWLIVYPRQITSLRHVWEHPDFPASGETGGGQLLMTKEEREIKEHKAWLLLEEPVAMAKQVVMDIAAKLGVSYDELMDHAAIRASSSYHYWSDGGRFEGESIDPDRFWPAYNTIKNTNEPNHGNFLSCSC